jgi:hypothetical protein
MWNGFNWLRVEFIHGLLWLWWWTIWFHNWKGNFWPAKQQPASQEELSLVELVTLIFTQQLTKLIHLIKTVFWTAWRCLNISTGLNCGLQLDNVLHWTKQISFLFLLALFAVSMGHWVNSLRNAYNTQYMFTWIQNPPPPFHSLWFAGNCMYRTYLTLWAIIRQRSFL